jgi:hypothetical protein
MRYITIRAQPCGLHAAEKLEDHECTFPQDPCHAPFATIAGYGGLNGCTGAFTPLEPTFFARMVLSHLFTFHSHLDHILEKNNRYIKTTLWTLVYTRDLHSL